MRSVITRRDLWALGHRRGRRHVSPYAAALAIVLFTVSQPQRIWAQDTPPPPSACPDGASTAPEPEWLKGVVRPKMPGVTLPRLIKSAKPNYPREAVDAKVTGEVWLDAVVEADGRIRNMCLVKSIPIFDAHAVEAARRFEFQAARRDGEAVPILVRLQLAFNLGEKEKK